MELKNVRQYEGESAVMSGRESASAGDQRGGGQVASE
jgi:hypothetical protein